MRFARLLACFGLLSPVLLLAGEGWAKKDYRDWSAAEAQRILEQSGWAKSAQGFIGTTDEDPHTYPVKGPSARDIGLKGDTEEWFPVGKIPTIHMPTLPVLVRWDSAIPVRRALLRTHAAELRDTEGSLRDPEKYYIITILGLAAAAKPAAPGDDAEGAHAEETFLRQALLNRSRLVPKGKQPIVPEDARVDQATGTIQIFFPKTTPIVAEDKEVAFGTVFGSVRVVQQFRLKDMVYQGKLEL